MAGLVGYPLEVLELFVCFLCEDQVCMMRTANILAKAVIKPDQSTINLGPFLYNEGLDCPQEDVAFRQPIQHPRIQQFVRGDKGDRTDQSLEAGVKYLKDRKAAGFDVNIQAVGLAAWTNAHRDAAFAVKVPCEVFDAGWVHRTSIQDRCDNNGHV